MVLCVIAGLHIRAFATEGSHSPECTESASECSSASQEDPHQHEGGDCPIGHPHHHGCCTHSLPLVFDNDEDLPLRDFISFLAGLRHEGEAPPDGPYLSSEKPPLI